MACSVHMRLVISVLIVVFMTSSVIGRNSDSLTAQIYGPLPLDGTSKTVGRQVFSNDVVSLPCEQTPVDRSRRNDPPFNESRYRYHVVMYGNSTTVCGAAIVSKTWLVTSASCVRQLRDPITVRAGFQTARPYSGEQAFLARSVLPHQNYSSSGQDFDLAHVTIVDEANRDRFNFTNRVQPVCYPSFNCQLPPASANLSMTGLDRDGTDQVLKLYRLTLMDRQTCSRKNLGFQLTSNMICATKLTNGSCDGFLGGPVVYKSGGKYIIAGLVSSCHEGDLVIITNIQLIGCISNGSSSGSNYSPSGSNDYPSGSNDYPSDSNDYPSGSNDYPSGSNDYPPGSNDYPSGSNDYPSVSNDYPPGSNDYPSGSNDYPPGSNDYPSGSNDYPSGSNDYPPGSNDYPSDSNDYPSGNNNYPPGSNDYPSGSNKQ